MSSNTITFAIYLSMLPTFLSENFCCQNVLVTSTSAKPELSGEYYLNYQKSNSSLKVYVRDTKPEMLLFQR
jgi:hypothetical protein